MGGGGGWFGGGRLGAVRGRGRANVREMVGVVGHLEAGGASDDLGQGEALDRAVGARVLDASVREGGVPFALDSGLRPVAFGSDVLSDFGDFIFTKPFSHVAGLCDKLLALCGVC